MAKLPRRNYPFSEDVQKRVRRITAHNQMDAAKEFRLLFDRLERYSEFDMKSGSNPRDLRRLELDKPFGMRYTVLEFLATGIAIGEFRNKQFSKETLININRFSPRIRKKIINIAKANGFKI